MIENEQSNEATSNDQFTSSEFSFLNQQEMSSKLKKVRSKPFIDLEGIEFNRSNYASNNQKPKYMTLKNKSYNGEPVNSISSMNSESGNVSNLTDVNCNHEYNILDFTKSVRLVLEEKNNEIRDFNRRRLERETVL